MSQYKSKPLNKKIKQIQRIFSTQKSSDLPFGNNRDWHVTKCTLTIYKQVQIMVTPCYSFKITIDHQQAKFTFRDSNLRPHSLKPTVHDSVKRPKHTI